jgi:hypothetical protein
MALPPNSKTTASGLGVAAIILSQGDLHTWYPWAGALICIIWGYVQKDA